MNFSPIALVNTSCNGLCDEYMNKMSDSRVISRQDIIIISGLILLGIISGLLLPNSNIGFYISMTSIIYTFIRGNRNTTIVIVMMFVLAYDYFGLVPYLSIGSGTLHWYDLNFVLAFLLFVKCLKKKKNSKFGIVIIIYFIFIMIACIQSRRLYGQSTLTTLGSARSAFVLLAYWPLLALIKYDLNLRNKFLLCFEKVTQLAIVLYWVQFVLVNLGLNVTYLPTKARWGVRIYINFIFLILFFFYSFYGCIYGKENIKKSIRQCVITVLTLIVVAQSRSTLVFITVVALIMTFASLKAQKMLKYFSIVMVGVIILSAIPATRNVILSSILETSDNETGSIAYRQLERQYYSNQLVGNEIFGVGIPNKHDTNALQYSGRKSEVVNVNHRQFNLADLGAFIIQYEFGIIAYFLYFTSLIILLISCFLRRKNNASTFATAAMCIYLIIDSSMIEVLTREPFIFMLLLFFAEINYDGKPMISEKVDK